MSDDTCRGCDCEECAEREVGLIQCHRDEGRAGALRSVLRMLRGPDFEASHARVSQYVESESDYVREMVKGG